MEMSGGGPPRSLQAGAASPSIPRWAGGKHALLSNDTIDRQDTPWWSESRLRRSMSISIPRWHIGSLCRLKRESKFQVSGHEHDCSKVVNHLGDEVMKVFSGMDLVRRMTLSSQTPKSDPGASSTPSFPRSQVDRPDRNGTTAQIPSSTQSETWAGQ